MTGDYSCGFVRCCPGPFQPPGGAQRKPAASPDGFDFPYVLTECVASGRVDTMACPPHTELSYAWEKYMDCRVQGADLQVRYLLEREDFSLASKIVEAGSRND